MISKFSSSEQPEHTSGRNQPPISWPCRPPSSSRLQPDHESCHGVVMSPDGAGMVRCACPVCDHPEPDLEQLQPRQPRASREQRW